MTVDNFSPVRMKRWLMEAYRPIRWDNHQEVTEAFWDLGICLKEMRFDQTEAILELKFIVHRITEETAKDLAVVVHRHGGEFVNYRLEVEHNVRDVHWSFFETVRFRGPQEAELTLWVIPPGARPRNSFAQALAAETVRAARILGHFNHHVVIQNRV